MLALSSTCFSKELFIIGRYDHNITKVYAVSMLLVCNLFQTVRGDFLLFCSQFAEVTHTKLVKGQREASTYVVWTEPTGSAERGNVGSAVSCAIGLQR